jgi:peptidoglycan L-alanyl-D-glutamate endopeptidase CwlK
VGFVLSSRSNEQLNGVHYDLVRVVRTAADKSPLEFVVTEGLRSLERQRQLLAAGATTTLRSRHLTGHAVDLAAVLHGEIRWDWPLYDALADTMKVAAHDLGVLLEWGGDWRTFKDGPHFQLPFGRYPDADKP